MTSSLNFVQKIFGEKLENLFFIFLVFFLPLGIRKYIGTFSVISNQWNAEYLYFSDLLILVIFGSWVIRSRLGRISEHWRFSAVEAALIDFLILVSISVLVSFSWAGLFSYGRLLLFAALFFWMRKNYSSIKWNKVFIAFILSALIQASWAIAQFFLQRDMGLRLLGESLLGPNISGVAKIVVGGVKLIRPYAFFPHPNVLAAFLGFVLFLFPPLFMKSRWHWLVKGLIFFGAFEIIVWGLILTFSRETLLAVSLAMVLGFLWAIRNRTERIAHVLICFFFAFSAFVGLFVVMFKNFFISRVEITYQDQAIQQRLSYQHFALQMIKAHPFFGVGWNNFTNALIKILQKPPFLFPSAAYQYWFIQPVHNIYLLIASESGLLALAAFLIFIFLLLREHLRRSSEIYLFLAVVSLLIIGLFDHFLLTLEQGSLILWIGLGMLFARQQSS